MIMIGWIQRRYDDLGSLDGISPDLHVVLVGWNAEPDPDGPLSPGNRVSLQQFLDTVLPNNPGLHPLRDDRGDPRRRGAAGRHPESARLDRSRFGGHSSHQSSREAWSRSLSSSSEIRARSSGRSLMVPLSPTSSGW